MFSPLAGQVPSGHARRRSPSRPGVLVGYFAPGTALNAISRSRPERLVMTPLCVLLTACALVVATGDRAGTPTRRSAG